MSVIVYYATRVESKRLTSANFPREAIARIERLQTT